MDSEKTAVVKQWFKKADSDLRTIENNIKSEYPPTDTICFHAQQAIEKLCKGSADLFWEAYYKNT